jgi:hypothetical protein
MRILQRLAIVLFAAICSAQVATQATSMTPQWVPWGSVPSSRLLKFCPNK